MYRSQDGQRPSLDVPVRDGDEYHEQDDHRADGDIDVEAPPPGCVLGQGASDQGPRDDAQL